MDSAEIRGPRAHAMIKLQPNPGGGDARHVSAFVEPAAHIVGEKTQIYHARLQGKYRFRFSAKKPRAGLYEILHLEIAVRIQNTVVIRSIGNSVAIGILSLHEYIVVYPAMEYIDFPSYCARMLVQ